MPGGRRQDPVDPNGGPAAEFALQLRELQGVAGLTLTQAILASGGTSRFAGSKVKVLRQGPDGRLVTTEYNLKQIENGKVPDPQLQPGDRVEIARGGW